MAVKSANFENSILSSSSPVSALPTYGRPVKTGITGGSTPDSANGSIDPCDENRFQNVTLSAAFLEDLHKNLPEIWNENSHDSTKTTEENKGETGSIHSYDYIRSQQRSLWPRKTLLIGGICLGIVVGLAAISGLAVYFSRRTNATNQAPIDQNRPDLFMSTVVKAQSFHRPSCKICHPPEPGVFHNGTVMFLAQEPMHFNTKYFLSHVDENKGHNVAVLACYMSRRWVTTGPIYDLTSRTIYLKDFLVNKTSLADIMKKFNVAKQGEPGKLFRPQITETC